MGHVVIAGGVTVFSLGDMIIYNRRKRNSFYAEAQLNLQKRLIEAREAAAKGIADEDQTLLLNRVRAAEEAEEARKAQKGVMGYVKSFFSSEGLKKEEGETGLEWLGEEGLRKMGEEASGSGLVRNEKEIEVPKDEVTKGGIVKAVEEKRREGERELEKKGIEGGPLDRMAKEASEAGKAKGGWTSWLTSK